MRRLALILCLGLCCPGPAGAHDIPNARVDRSIQATLEPGRLTIDYEVSLSELTLTRDLRALIGVLPGADRRDWFDSYGRETGPLDARGFLLTVDGRPVDVRFLGFDLAVEDHPRYTFHFEAETPAGGHLSLLDSNFASSEGTSRLALRGRGGVRIRGDDLPGDVEAIPIRPLWQLSDAEERRTRSIQVDYASPPTGPEPAASRPAPPPVTSTSPSPSPPQRPAPPAADRSGARARPGRADGLSRLLDEVSRLSLAGLIAMAVGLGALHALQPGHGKTLVAASVLGERGRWYRGTVLALVTTLTHTGSVLLVALGLWWTGSSRYGAIQRGLAGLAGFVIAAIGLWRLGRHLAGHGEHDRPGRIGPAGEAEVEPEFGPGPAPAAGALGGRGLIGLGIAEGLVPCWDAVALIVLAEAIGRLGLGIVLLLAFGAGMALVLVAVGALAGRIRRYAVGTLAPSADGPWERRLGVVSGLVLAAIGVYLMGQA